MGLQWKNMHLINLSLFTLFSPIFIFLYLSIYVFTWATWVLIKAHFHFKIQHSSIESTSVKFNNVMLKVIQGLIIIRANIPVWRKANWEAERERTWTLCCDKAVWSPDDTPASPNLRWVSCRAKYCRVWLWSVKIYIIVTSKDATY